MSDLESEYRAGFLKALSIVEDELRLAGFGRDVLSVVANVRDAHHIYTGRPPARHGRPRILGEGILTRSSF